MLADDVTRPRESYEKKKITKDPHGGGSFAGK